LLVDHSTDPLQNTCRQYTNQSQNTIPIEGRFANHEMIIRRNGETTILRPKHDLVLARGFTPVIRPSSILPSYHSINSKSQPELSLSIINKMSTKKNELQSVIKTKRKRCRDKTINNGYKKNYVPDAHLLRSFKQTLYDLIERVDRSKFSSRNSKQTKSKGKSRS